jgi:hypothetical protein
MLIGVPEDAKCGSAAASRIYYQLPKDLVPVARAMRVGKPQWNVLSETVVCPTRCAATQTKGKTLQ